MSVINVSHANQLLLLQLVKNQMQQIISIKFCISKDEKTKQSLMNDHVMILFHYVIEFFVLTISLIGLLNKNSRINIK